MACETKKGDRLLNVGISGLIESACCKILSQKSFRKLPKTSVLQNAGWSAEIDIKFGIKSFYGWYLTNRLRVAA